MGSTNKTTNLQLPQWIGTDKPTFLGDFNDAFLKIDNGYGTISGDASTAIAQAGQAVHDAENALEKANSVEGIANNANTNANNALSTANNAYTESQQAINVANQKLSAITKNDWVTLIPNYAQNVSLASGHNFYASYIEKLMLFNLAFTVRNDTAGFGNNSPLFTLSNFTFFSGIVDRQIESGVFIRKSGGDGIFADLVISNNGEVTIQNAGAASPDYNLAQAQLMLNISGWF